MTPDREASRIAAPANPSPAPIPSSPALLAATGRDRAGWFALLDAWGAAGRPYPEIAAWLRGEQGLSAWWAQKLIVEYEQARGIRGAGARRDGSFTAGASRTIDTDPVRVLAAFADPGIRAGWLPGVALVERTAQPGRSARYDWGNDSTRIRVAVEALAGGRCRVSVEHERLPDAAAADRARAEWADRLAALKAHLAG